MITFKRTFRGLSLRTLNYIIYYIQVTGAFSQRDDRFSFSLRLSPYFEISNGSSLLSSLSLNLDTVAPPLYRHKGAIFVIFLMLHCRRFKSPVHQGRDPARFSVLPGGNRLLRGIWNPKFPPGWTEILVGSRPLRTGFRQFSSCITSGKKRNIDKVVWLRWQNIDATR